MTEWTKTTINEFLTERAGRYKPNDSEVTNLKRVDKIDFSGGMHFSDKSSKTNMIIVKKGDLVISGIKLNNDESFLLDKPDTLFYTGAPEYRQISMYHYCLVQLFKMFDGKLELIYVEHEAQLNCSIQF